MIARLTRNYFNDRRTLGKFQLIEGNSLMFECFTCEDVVRGDGDPNTVDIWKVENESAIPYGTYPLRFTYSKKFGCNKWQVCDVKGFSGIRIHSGNTEHDTSGCILLGTRIDTNYTKVLNSRQAVSNFETIMERLGNKPCQIEIVAYKKA